MRCHFLTAFYKLFILTMDTNIAQIANLLYFYRLLLIMCCYLFSNYYLSLTCFNIILQQ